MAMPVSPQDCIEANLGDEVAFVAAEGWPLYVEPVTETLKSSFEAALAWFQDRRQAVDQLLAQHGAIILRGFPLTDAATFSRFIRHLPPMPRGYAGGAARREQLADRVYDTTSTRAATFTTRLHQEMAYMPVFPLQIAFFCHIPPGSGGETTIGDIRRLQPLLPAEVLEKVRSTGVRYVRSFRAPDQNIDAPDAHQPQLQAFYRPWTEAFNTESQTEAEKVLRATGLDFEWLPGGGLTTHFHSSGFTDHPITGEHIWFNQLTLQNANHVAAGMTREVYARAFPPGAAKSYDTTYGDGVPLREAVMLDLYRIQESIMVAPQWRSGDLMLLDNIYTGHGANPYTGDRDIQVSMFH